MFKESNKEPQFDLFGGVHSLLDDGSLKEFNNDSHRHNHFRKQIVSRIDETEFKALFNKHTGANSNKNYGHIADIFG